MPLRMPHEPILATPLTRPIPVTWAVEAKWDGYRVLLAHRAGGGIEIRSRRGTDLTKAFPDIASAAWRDLPADTSSMANSSSGTRAASPSSSSDTA
jgi:ATP-dependent DNA ligase